MITLPSFKNYTFTISTATCIASSNQLTKRSDGSYECILNYLSSSTIVF